MNIELTENETLVIKIYMELARAKSNDPEAKAGFERIIQKLEKLNNNRA